jgi:hypothetical protein
MGCDEASNVHMSPLSRLFAAAAIMLTAAPAAAQVNEACAEFAKAEVIFVGRVKSAPITRRISGEDAIEKARVVKEAAERELKAFEALKFPPEIGGGQHRDLAIRMVKASEEYNKIRASYPPPFDLFLTPVLAETPFRGVPPGDLFMMSRGHPELDPAKSYLIYAAREMGFLAPDVITLRRAVDVADAEAHLRFLNDTANDSGTFVNGSLTMADPANPQRPLPLSDVVLRVSLEDQHIETVTAADGTFILVGVPPGQLRVEPVLPEHLILPPQSNGGVTRGGCLTIHLRATLNGRIRGRVLLDSGEPFRGLVDVLGDEPDLRHFTTSPVRTNERGEFAFSGLKPGRYVVGVNIARQPTTSSPFRPTYFPGTTDRLEAMPIVVGEGTEQTNLEWIVSSRLGEGSVQVSLDTPGQLQKTMGVCVTLFDSDNRNNGGLGYERRPDGTMIVPVVEGVRYRLVAHARVPSGYVQSEVFDLIGAPGRQSLKLSVASISAELLGNDCWAAQSDKPFSPSR